MTLLYFYSCSLSEASYFYNNLLQNICCTLCFLLLGFGIAHFLIKMHVALHFFSLREEHKKHNTQTIDVTNIQQICGHMLATLHNRKDEPGKKIKQFLSIYQCKNHLAPVKKCISLVLVFGVRHLSVFMNVPCSCYVTHSRAV